MKKASKVHLAPTCTEANVPLEISLTATAVPADPFNDHEPVDSSAAAIGAQGLLRVGRFLQNRGQKRAGDRYWQAGLTVLRTLLGEPYLSTDKKHQGLLLATSSGFTQYVWSASTSTSSLTTTS